MAMASVAADRHLRCWLTEATKPAPAARRRRGAAAGSLFCAEAAQRALSTVVARSAGRPLAGSCERKPWSPALHGICLLVPRSRSLALSPNKPAQRWRGTCRRTRLHCPHRPKPVETFRSHHWQHGLAQADRLVWPGLLGESSLRIQANVISIVLKDSSCAIAFFLVNLYLHTYMRNWMKTFMNECFSMHRYL